MSEHNRLPEPPPPEVLCMLNLNSAMCHLADAIVIDGGENQEWYDWQGLLWALKLFASSLESGIKVHPLIRKSNQKVLKKLIQVQREDIDAGYMRYETLQTITPSAN
jgi:hypothetical protein